MQRARSLPTSAPGQLLHCSAGATRRIQRACVGRHERGHEPSPDKRVRDWGLNVAPIFAPADAPLLPRPSIASRS